jgi:methionyl-tRNA formyltransferase
VEKADLAGTPESIGRIVRQDARGLYIQTGQGILVPDELQMEGRRRMSAAEFLRGYVIRDISLA